MPFFAPEVLINGRRQQIECGRTGLSETMFENGRRMSQWIRAIDFSPKLASYCPHWREFTPMEWATLIAGNKDFINIAPRHSFGDAEWFIILHRQPTLIDKCEILNDMPEKYWTFLKKLYPWFEKK